MSPCPYVLNPFFAMRNTVKTINPFLAYSDLEEKNVSSCECNAASLDITNYTPIHWTLYTLLT